ncbi:ribose-phosphate diphosphokinase [Haliangium ochraceum]|uniref:ribose-phosphate diphosphokinase n=1 Tax=Haliangium ochraceum (strain DSM 14365 / JCM 11303 / SMP-2) TaxID=502025 RepID=D0LIU2_HALO1|nr:ribose-phosphate diphosphokinase [Haliangium ochraceum]ACY12971.1 ribose-phosphate pyrophosphokinase [Haliangium ochraceum DSM 14365]
MAQPLLYTTAAYAYLGDELRASGGFAAGEIEQQQFPDGERYRRLLTPCDDRDVILLGGTISDSDTLELYDLACALVYYGARRLSLVIPYFGYSTMERAVRPGEVVTAKTRARLLSSIPGATMGNRVFLFDLHVAGVTHYFEGQTHPVHVYGKPVISDLVRRLGGDDFVLACTDAGRAKWVSSLANDLGVSAAFAYKRRISGSRTEVAGVSAHVAGKCVVIYDDMIRTGGSLLGAARAYRDAGASDVAAICTHGLFPEDALARLRDSGVVSRVACTNSHPRANELACDYLSVESIAPLLAQRLRTRV